MICSQVHWSKGLLAALVIVFAAGQAGAQKTSVTEIPMSEDTTISIKKGSAAAKCEKLFEIVDGIGQIEGEPNVLVKEARASWKQACNQWKRK